MFIVALDLGQINVPGLPKDILIFEKLGQAEPDLAYKKAFDMFLKWSKKEGELIEPGFSTRDFNGANAAFIHPFKLEGEEYKQCLGLVFKDTQIAQQNFTDVRARNSWIADIMDKLQIEAAALEAEKLKQEAAEKAVDGEIVEDTQETTQA